MPLARTSGVLPTHYMPGPPALTALASLATLIELRRDPIGFMVRLQRQYGNLVALAGTRKRVIAAFGAEHNAALYGNSSPEARTKDQNTSSAIPIPRPASQT